MAVEWRSFGYVSDIRPVLRTRAAGRKEIVRSPQCCSPDYTRRDPRAPVSSHARIFPWTRSLNDSRHGPIVCSVRVTSNHLNSLCFNIFVKNSPASSPSSCSERSVFLLYFSVLVISKRENIKELNE